MCLQVDWLVMPEKKQYDKGGTTQIMVNEKTDYLVIGGFQINMFDLDYFSFKQRRAQELIAKGVPIQLIDEEQFLDLINV